MSLSLIWDSDPTLSTEFAKKMYASDGLYPNKGYTLDYFVWYRNVKKKERYPTGNGGLGGSFAKIWRDQRTAVNPDMMKKKAALYYVESTDKIGADCIDRITETRDENNEIRNAIPDFAYTVILVTEKKECFLDLDILY